MNEGRLWTRSFILMITGTAFLFIAFYSLYPTLPLFITHLGGDDAQVGAAMGVFMLTSVLFRPVVGSLLDRFGRRLFVAGGLILFGATMYLYGRVTGVAGLMWLRVLHGMSWAVASTAVQTSVTDAIPAERRGEGVGWLGMAMTVAMAAGPAWGTWVVQHLSYDALFLSGAALSVIALLFMSSAKSPYPGNPAGKSIDFTKGEGIVIAPALVITSAGLAVLSLSRGLPGMLVSAVLFGIGYGSAQPVLLSAAIRLAGERSRGLANAAVSTATDLGIGLGAIMLGIVAQHTSYRGVFSAGALSVVLSLLVFLACARRRLASRPGSDRAILQHDGGSLT